MMKPLTDLIRSYIHIDDDTLNTIISEFRERVVAKEQFVLKQGQVATDYFFVKSGGLRIFFENGEKQVTGWVALENDFFAELSSLKKQMPSRCYIQAIENTVLLTIKRDKMEELYTRFPLWQEFGRQVWEDAFLKVIEGIIAFQTLTAEERYLAAMQRSELFGRIPLKDLSSFLGITPNSLSRIRKNIR